MLKSTFLHIPYVSENTERELWRRNILTWDDFSANGRIFPFSDAKKERISGHIRRSQEALLKKDHRFFSASIPVSMHWRAYREFSGNCAFVDIETTGLDKHRNSITTVGIYDGKESKIFIKGKDLDEVPKELSKYSMIVTFNGRCFDMPFIQAKFPEVNFDGFHIDLRFLMRKLGFSGGLKLIEKAMGIVREDEIAEVDGFEAVRLWRKYERGDEKALQTLLEYNRADIENLKILMDIAFDKAKDEFYYPYLN